MFLEKKNKGKNKNQCSILKGYNQDDIYEKSNVERKRDNKKKRCYLWDSIEHFSLQKKKKKTLKKKKKKNLTII